MKKLKRFYADEDRMIVHACLACLLCLPMVLSM